ncbi:Uncharacterised protein [Candidatus Tiddalikarchaeum anstoanum]|nr:Uncharacterised protein [Candidatus Tiddalikarchaeum anstoanum]
MKNNIAIKLIETAETWASKNKLTLIVNSIKVEYLISDNSISTGNAIELNYDPDSKKYESSFSGMDTDTYDEHGSVNDCVKSNPTIEKDIHSICIDFYNGTKNVFRYCMGYNDEAEIKDSKINIQELGLGKFKDLEEVLDAEVKKISS